MPVLNICLIDLQGLLVACLLQRLQYGLFADVLGAVDHRDESAHLTGDHRRKVRVLLDQLTRVGQPLGPPLNELVHGVQWDEVGHLFTVHHLVVLQEVALVDGQELEAVPQPHGVSQVLQPLPRQVDELVVDALGASLYDLFQPIHVRGLVPHHHKEVQVAEPGHEVAPDVGPEEHKGIYLG